MRRSRTLHVGSGRSAAAVLTAAAATEARPDAGEGIDVGGGGSVRPAGTDPGVARSGVLPTANERCDEIVHRALTVVTGAERKPGCGDTARSGEPSEGIRGAP